MLYGIYQSAAGLQLNQYRQEVLANNLANLETTGFKHDLAVVRERPLATRESMGRPDWSNPSLSGLTGGSYVAPTYTSFAQGPLDHTGGRLDVGLFGDGFFTVRDGDTTRYTRDGRFVINAASELTTVSGHKVLDEGGQPIVIPSDVAEKTTITSAGDVRAGANKLGRLAVVDFEDKRQLTKLGSNLFDAGNARATESHASLQPGFVEGSTVEPTEAMVSMIEVSRAYEFNATMIGLADGTLARAVNDIARLS